MSAQLTNARWQQACLLFETAVEQPASTRQSWLLSHCADTELRQMVAAMLAADASDLADPEPATRWLLDGFEEGWPAGMQLGAYRIERRLGQGGMGEVYLAQRCDGTVIQRVAIKRLRSSLHRAELERRFLAERQILARLVHPHIARFLDAGSSLDGEPYAVIEYVDGVPITAHAEHCGLDTPARLRLFLQVAEAVDHAHRQLIVHRDIKPGNVLVHADGSPRLLDFGIAKVLAPEGPASVQAQTDFGSRAFSLPHAAPEQLRGEPVGVACDVYGLGVLLYELLTGRLPIRTEGLSYGEAERLILEHSPPAPSSVAPSIGLRGDLDRIILHALKKHPDERYRSVAALMADLQRHLQRKPISLRRDHRWYQLRLLLQRHPWPIGLGLGLGLAIIVGSAMVYRQGRLAAEQRDQARAAMGLLQSAFRASNPLQISNAPITLDQFLAAARPELEQRFAEQPRLYVELAATLADVELALGRPSQANALSERAWQAWQREPADAELGQSLQLLRARAALAAADYERLEGLLLSTPAAAPEHALDWQLLRARLLGHRGEHAAAVELLQGLLTSHAHLPVTDERALELRLQTAQALRFEGNSSAALQLIEATIAWQRADLPADHPRLLLSRLHRLPLLAARDGVEASLAEANELLPQIELSFGAHSTVHAAALSAVGAILNSAGRPQESAEAFEVALESWRLAAGETHQNTLRTAFNLAQLRAEVDPADARLEPLMRAVVARGEATLGEDHQAVLFWRVAWAEQRLQRGELESAHSLIVDRLPLLQQPDRRGLLDRYLQHAGSAAAARCTDAQADPPCQRFKLALARLRSTDGGVPDAGAVAQPANQGETPR